MATPIRRKFIRSNGAQWYGVLDGLINIGPGQRARKFKETGLIGGGVIVQKTRKCYHPRISPNGGKINNTLHLQGAWIDAHHPPYARGIIWAGGDAAFIDDID